MSPLPEPARAPAHTIFRQFMSFSGVGLAGTSTHYITLLALVEALGIGPVAASATGFVIGALVNYVLNYKITFRSESPHWQALPKFLTVSLVAFCLNFVIMAVGTKWLPGHYLWVQLLAA